MCKVCDHPNNEKINLALAVGKKNPTIFHDFIGYAECDEDKKCWKRHWIQALKDHRRYGHIPGNSKDTANDSEKRQRLDIEKCIQEIYDIATGSAKDAREAKIYGAVGSCLNPATKVLEILNKGNEGNPSETKDSGFMSGYMKRAEEVYAESPKS